MCFILIGKKGGKAASKGSMSLSPTELQEIIDFAGMKDQFSKTVDHLKLEYIQQLSLRTSAGEWGIKQRNINTGQLPQKVIRQKCRKQRKRHETHGLGYIQLSQ